MIISSFHENSAGFHFAASAGLLGRFALTCGCERVSAGEHAFIIVFVCYETELRYPGSGPNSPLWWLKKKKEKKGG